MAISNRYSLVAPQVFKNAKWPFSVAHESKEVCSLLPEISAHPFKAPNFS